MSLMGHVTALLMVMGHVAANKLFLLILTVYAFVGKTIQKKLVCHRSLVLTAERRDHWIGITEQKKISLYFLQGDRG